jgi:hypothetical protein
VLLVAVDREQRVEADLFLNLQARILKAKGRGLPELKLELPPRLRSPPRAVLVVLLLLVVKRNVLLLLVMEILLWLTILRVIPACEKPELLLQLQRQRLAEQWRLPLLLLQHKLLCLAFTMVR